MPKKYKFIAGVDEVGRGALCGPVVSACVCFKHRVKYQLRDSKEISPSKREELSDKIRGDAFYSFGLVREDSIDKLNIFWASQLSFLKSIERFLSLSGFNKEDVLFIIDGPYFKYGGYNAKCVVSADKTIRVVSAASILAKVLRDRILRSYDRLFPGWGFAKHKGYSTEGHRQRIKEKGVSPIHRMSFNLGL